MSTYVTAFPNLLEENFDAPSLVGPRIRTMICADTLDLTNRWDVSMDDLFVVVRQRQHTSQMCMFQANNHFFLDPLRNRWVHLGKNNVEYAYRSENIFRYLSRATADLWAGCFDTPDYWKRMGMEIIYGSEFAIGEFLSSPSHMFNERLN